MKKEQSEPKHRFNYEDLPEMEVRLKSVPYFAYVSDDPNFTALTFTGKTPEAAFQVAQAHATVYYKGKFRVNTVIEE